MNGVSRELFGEDVVWIPYVRPGFGLAKLAIEALKSNPRASGMFLAKHGLVTWGESGQESYTRTIDILRRAESVLNDQLRSGEAFGGQVAESPREACSREVMVNVLPVIRGALSEASGGDRRWILHWDNSPEVLEFVNSRDVWKLAETGAACPDHVMYTKFVPLVLDQESFRLALLEQTDSLAENIRQAIRRYCEEYQAWFEEYQEDGVEMLDPGPRVILIPGLGLVTAGRDKWAATNTASLYRTAIGVMRWASAAGTYTSLTPKEAWNIEYWPLELYKLSLRPPDRDLGGHVAMITGGAGGIGRATARRFLQEDAHVVVTDIDGQRAIDVATDLGKDNPQRVYAVASDATVEVEVIRAFEETVLEYGGCDIVVPNAGMASASPIEETSVAEWTAVYDILTRGYFLACRQAFCLFKRQGTGGALVLNSSKNGLAPGKNAIAYATAKAAELHMCRCLAEEGGEHGIRVNAVAPDAVIRGSGLWNDQWNRERARTYGFEVEDIEEFYRSRNALKVNVQAEDVAEAILWLASKRSAKTTGCVITVDGGVSTAYPR